MWLVLWATFISHCVPETCQSNSNKSLGCMMILILSNFTIALYILYIIADNRFTNLPSCFSQYRFNNRSECLSVNGRMIAEGSGWLSVEIQHKSTRQEIIAYNFTHSKIRQTLKVMDIFNFV